VLRADSSSTERDLKTMGVAMAGYELGVPIERHLMDIMRRLIKEGIWQVNELGARVWNINGGIYLVWPASGDEIAAKVRTDDLKGFPRTADGILDMLLERGLAFVKEGGDERFWKIVPAVLEAKIPNKSLACIRLRDDAMISSTPIPAIAGRLLNAEDDEGEEESADTTAAAAAEPTTPAPAPVKLGGKTRTADREHCEQEKYKRRSTAARCPDEPSSRKGCCERTRAIRFHRKFRWCGPSDSARGPQGAARQAQD
jgi:conjugal transfer pilus assembly protein TraI